MSRQKDLDGGPATRRDSRGSGRGGVVVITGASSGIGRAIAQQVAARAKEVALVARRADRLEELAEEMKLVNPALVTRIYPCDLGDRRARDATIAELCHDLPRIDVLVNCAGLGDLGVFDRSSLEKQLGMIELNVSALVALTHAVLPSMVERGAGSILMVSSGFGLTFLPGLSTYIGTKHFVTGFTEALRLDLAGTGVYVGQICPGPVATEFEQGTGNFTGQKVPAFLELTAEECARACIRTLDRRRALVVPHPLIWLAIWIGARSPRWLTRLVLAPVGKLLRRRQLDALTGP
ncbi:MAG: SDR family oxidoreductase [Polyangiaceae bacterium]